MYASKLMRGPGLSQEQRTQVLFNAGGVYDPERLSQVLRTTHRDIQDQDERRGKVYPQVKRNKDIQHS